jgi:hypothetical protein
MDGKREHSLPKSVNLIEDIKREEAQEDGEGD